MRYFPASLAMVLVAVFVSGCLPGKEEAPNVDDMERLRSEATPGQLVEEFTRMANDPDTYSDDVDRLVLMDMLMQMGPSTLSPIIGLIAAPDSSPETRIFVLQGLVGRVGPQYMGELKPLLESEDSIVRACAATILGEVKHPEAVMLLQGALNDGAEAVRFSALSSLAVQGDAQARKDLCAKYFEADRHTAHKEEIIRVILRAPEAQDQAILIQALDEDFVEIKTRAVVAVALGEIGDSAAIPPLEQSLTQYTEPVFVELASIAIEAIKEREA